MPTTPFDEYSTTLKSAGPPPDYKVKDTSQLAGGLVLGEELSAGDQFVFDNKIYTYAGGADTGPNGFYEVGFFATTGSGASLKTHFFSQTPDTNGNTYYLNKNQGYTVANPPCFVRGTRLAGPDRDVAVEDLAVGDLLLTTLNGETAARPVKWIGRRRVNLSSHPRPETVEPVRIRSGAFAENVPHRDLLVSPDHAIFVDGKLICARQLVNGTTIRIEKGLGSVEYFHVELDDHSILLAEGLTAESYLNTGNRGFFIDGEAPVVLHPDMTAEADYPHRELTSCAPFAWTEDAVRPVWERLAERAANLGLPVPVSDTAADPDLYIVAQGRTVRPLSVTDGLYRFALPPGSADVRVVSRRAAPNDIRPWAEDRRRLGVYAERIVMRGANDVREIPIDHPSLSEGWWAVERSGTGLRRWTDGDAVVPLPVTDGVVILEIRASCSGMQYPVGAERRQSSAA